MGRRNKGKLDGYASLVSKGAVENEISKVFVRVFPEGGTRILKFSDAPDTSLPDAEKNMAILRKKMEHLQQSVAAVDKYVVKTC